jgi:putative thiamine transport system substrate-binding protein
MISLLSKSLPSGFVVYFLLVFVATVNANKVLKPVATVEENSTQWQQTLKAARGQSVYFYAWGGSKAVNDYIRWATREIAQQYRIKLIHVKVTDPSEPVSRLKAENGRISAIDLMWVNGENFAYLKQQGFLLGNLWSDIPNSAF